MAFEAFGLMCSSQASLDHSEPRHGSDYWMMHFRAKMPPATPAMKMVPLNRRTLKNLHHPHHATPNSRFVLYGLEHYLRLYFEQRPRNHWLAVLSKRSVEHQQ